MSRRLVLVKERVVEVSEDRDVLSKVRGRFAAVSTESGYAYTATSNGGIIQTQMGKENLSSKPKEVLYRIHEVRGSPAESSFRILRPFSTFQLACSKDGSEHFVFTLAGQRKIMIAKVPEGVLNVTYQVHLLGTHSATVTSLALQNEEDLLASASADGCVKVWDLKSGLEVASVGQAHQSSVTALAFGFRFKVISGAADGTVCLWAIDAGTKALVKLQQFQIPIGVMPISSVDACMAIERKRGEKQKLLSGLWIAAGAEDGSIYVWSSSSPEDKWGLVMSHQYARSAPIKCLAFDSIHNTMLVSGWSAVKTPTLYVYSIPSFKCIGECATKSSALRLQPRTRMQLDVCLENLRVVKLTVPRSIQEVEERPEEKSSREREVTFMIESDNGGVGAQEREERILSSETDEVQSGDEEGGPRSKILKEANSPTPFPRKMPQEIQELIHKLKNNGSLEGRDEQPQPRQVPAAVVNEVCSTSVPSNDLANKPVPVQVVRERVHKGTKINDKQVEHESSKEKENKSKLRHKKKKKKKKKREEKSYDEVPITENELAQPRLCSTAMLQDRIETLENESFDPSESVRKACKAKAIKQGMLSSNLAAPKKISLLYNGLTPIVDQVPDRKLRKVGKQVDPTWMQSVQVRPRIEDCWQKEERVPQVSSCL